RDQIRVTGRREGAVVVIEISDTGPGLSEKARAHLFEAFQGSTRTGSVGLGLAIVAELVRAHGGEVRLVEGTIGATFRLSIPDRPVALDRARGGRAGAWGAGPWYAASCRLVRPTIRSLSLRGPSAAREPGIHNHRPWLWIPGSPLRGAPE